MKIVWHVFIAINWIARVIIDHFVRRSARGGGWEEGKEQAASQEDENRDGPAAIGRRWFEHREAPRNVVLLLPVIDAVAGSGGAAVCSGKPWGGLAGADLSFRNSEHHSMSSVGGASTAADMVVPDGMAATGLTPYWQHRVFLIWSDRRAAGCWIEVVMAA
jgi:hypothetical protein